MNAKATIAGLTAAMLLQACATTELAAPPAPCASAERDCGPAKPLNVAVAQSPFVQVSANA